MKYRYRHQELYKDVKIDIRAHTQKELFDKLQKKREKIDRTVIGDSMRLRDFCRLYLKTYKENAVQASWYEDLLRISDGIINGIGNKPIGKIKPIEVQDYLNTLTVYSDSTIKKTFDLTKQIFRQAWLNGATSYRFDLILPKGKQATSGRSLTKPEQAALLHVITGHRGELFISIMYYCGLRPSEAAALLWKDIDLENEILHVNKALKKDGTIGSTKSAAGVRDIPIPHELTAILRKANRPPFLPVCQQRNGYYTKSSMRKLWDSVKKKMTQELGYSIEPLRLYDLRHTYCTNLEIAGVPINIASRLLGHSDISITSKI